MSLTSSLVNEASISTEENENGDDYHVVYLGTNTSYRNEPLAFPGQAAQAYCYKEDVDSIPLATIEARFEGRIKVDITGEKNNIKFSCKI